MEDFFKEDGHCLVIEINLEYLRNNGGWIRIFQLSNVLRSSEVYFN